jgi:hypothetical protein
MQINIIKLVSRIRFLMKNLSFKYEGRLHKKFNLEYKKIN